MFFGMILEGPKAKRIVHSNSALIRLSNVAWEFPTNRNAQTKKDAKLFLKQSGRKYLICCLSRNNPQAMLDLYLLSTDEAAVQLEGDGRLHLSGYYEPKEQEQMEQVLDVGAKATQTKKANLNGKKGKGGSKTQNGNGMVEPIKEEDEEEIEFANEAEKQDYEDLMKLNDEELNQLIQESEAQLENELDEEDLKPEQPEMTRSEKKQKADQKEKEPAGSDEEDLEALEDMEGLDELEALEAEFNDMGDDELENLDDDDLDDLDVDDLEGLEDNEEPEPVKKPEVKKKVVKKKLSPGKKVKTQVQKVSGGKNVKSKKIKKKVVKKSGIVSVQKKFSQPGQKMKGKKKKMKNRKKQR